MAYGAAAQAQFEHNANEPMNKGFAAVSYDAAVLNGVNLDITANNTNGFLAKSATLELGGAFTYVFKYAVDASLEGKTLRLTVTGAKTDDVELVKRADGFYYAEVKDIAAKDMDTNLVVTPYVDGENVSGEALTYSGYIYAGRTINKNASANLVAVAQAFAMYVKAADVYFAGQN